MTKPKSVAAILERELEATVREWLKRVNLLPELTHIPLSDTDRTCHLLKLYSDLIARLRLPLDADPTISTAATSHGKKRRDQGYTPAMLVEESRLFEIVTFQTLHMHQAEIDQGQLLAAIIVIADEADSHLMQAVISWERQ